MGIEGTLMGYIQHWAQTKPKQGALHRLNASGEWDAVSWRQYWERVRRVGRGLMALGLQPGDSVSLIANNIPDWVICQHGITAAAGIPCPIYTTNLPLQVAYIVDHSESKIVILDEAEQLDKIRQAQAEGRARVEHIITIMDLGVDAPDVMTLADVEAKGLKETAEADLDARLDAVKLSDVALRVYTSGTTGVPKGAELTHDGIQATTDGVMGATDSILKQRSQRSVSYLPLCHAAEQIFTNFIGLSLGCEYYFCPKLDQLKDHLVKSRPTYLLAVPRVWEKFEAALRGQLGRATGIKKSLADWALATEKKAVLKEIETGKPQGGLQRRLARRLVIDKIHTALGLDELEFAVSGAAPISKSTLEFFASIGIPIHEGFGMTETTGVATSQPAGRPRFGTVGKVIPGVEARISDEGELLLRGRNMVRGYHKLPEKTAELYDGDWMRTGDMAEIDADGFIKITGRVKDLIITAGGKNVGPGEMENHLLSIPGIGQAVAVGDRKPYITALLVLEHETLPTLLRAAGVGESLTPDQAAKNARVLAYLKAQVEEKCNAKVARYQQIKYFEVLPTPFSIEGGELTPTMKIKRNVVTKKYAAQIEDMYTQTEPVGAAN